MSIPDFNERGVLPKGLHKCSSGEFINRFCKFSGRQGCSEIRYQYTDVLKQLFEYSIKRGAKSIIIGGSFVTQKNMPSDVDCIVIVPNEKCMPNKSEIMTIAECKLDLIYLAENDTEKVSRFINMFALDRFELDVGLIEVSLDGKNSSVWGNFLGECDFTKLMEYRSIYFHRHFVVGSEKRGLLVTIHGLNTFGEWNYDLAPVASSNDWIFAPFNYGNVIKPIISYNETKKILDRFRNWINLMYNNFQMNPSIIAHSFGTFLLGKYLEGFNYDPPVKFKNIVLAGSILNSEFDWNICFEKKCVQSVYNIIAPNDPYVPYIETINWIRSNRLYGTSGTTGFEQSHKQLISEQLDIYDHSNMLKSDIFEKKIIPQLNMGSFGRKDY